MSENRKALHDLLDQLPETEISSARRFLEFLVNSVLEVEPIDAKTGAELDAALAEGGTPIPLDAMKRQLGI
jgi:hypothetical protein